LHACFSAPQTTNPSPGFSVTLEPSRLRLRFARRSPVIAAATFSALLRPNARVICYTVNMPPPIVQVRNLSKIYGHGENQVVALNRISLDLFAGEFVALMGPSGSGKSTLLHIIAGIDRPTSGQCIVLGTDVSELDESQLADWRKDHVGFVFQSFNLIPVLTAFENVELPLLLTNLSTRERREHVEAALKLVGLGDRQHHLPKEMSGGQEQRVAIARALVTDPTLIVADEPTGNLDAHSAADVLTLMQSLNREWGKTIIIVTHDPKAASYAKRTVHLEKGQLLNGNGQHIAT
jgi:putative ABC transport system ATP-binding protein